MSKFIFCLLLLVFGKTFAGSPAKEKDGGSTTVGDGGYAVKCNDKFEFLDLFEAKAYLASNTLKPSFSEVELKGKISSLIQSLANFYNLQEPEIMRLTRVSRSFFNKANDPWADPGMFSSYRYFLQAKPPEILFDVAQNILQNECKLQAVALKPPSEMEGATRSIEYQALCDFTRARRGECLLVDRYLFTKLEPSHQLCLVAHELLRFLPQEYQAKSELELRQNTINFCLE